MNRRVVFDTSTLLSAALRIGSIPHLALVEAFAMFDLCASSQTMAELERVLESSKFDRYLDRPSRDQFLSLIQRHVHLFAVRQTDLQNVHPPCRDGNDNQFLALATVSQARLLVSSDEDLLILNPWHDLAILRPAEFLAINQPPQQDAP